MAKMEETAVPLHHSVR